MTDNSPITKLAGAFEEYEASMGLDSLTQILAKSLLACARRLDKSKTVEYSVETDFVSGTVVINLKDIA